MACLQLRAPAPLRVITGTILMSAMFFMSIKTGCGMKQVGICRPVCTGSDCITINQDRVDFQTAEEACRESNGQLLTLQSETDLSLFDILSQELFVNFWIGLRLPAGICSNLSAPLRGYEWTAGNTDRSIIPSFSTWTDSVKLCSPYCVSLSNDQKWTERPCSAKTDGFLCKTRHKDACRAQGLSASVVFKSSEGCLKGPCQHNCKDIPGGYTCSCFNGYIPDSKDPRQCIMFCAKQKCPAICDSYTGQDCFCPPGFLLDDDTFCKDIDECGMMYCDHECKNTYGSFVCSCRKGYVLKHEVKCIKSKGSQEVNVSTPAVTEVVKPSGSNNTVKGSSASTGGFLWIWIVVAVAVLVFILVIRFHIVKRQRRREQNTNQQSAVPAPVDNIEC